MLKCNTNDLGALISFGNCSQSEIDDWNYSDSNCCTWSGVTCDDSTTSSKRVVRSGKDSQESSVNLYKAWIS